MENHDEMGIELEEKSMLWAEFVPKYIATLAKETQRVHELIASTHRLVEVDDQGVLTYDGPLGQISYNPTTTVFEWDTYLTEEFHRWSAEEMAAWRKLYIAVKGKTRRFVKP